MSIYVIAERSIGDLTANGLLLTAKGIGPSDSIQQ